MDKDLVFLQRSLEQIKYTQDEMEYWSARELMGLLGYQRWESFSEVIKKAMVASKLLDIKLKEHFRETTKMIIIGRGAKRLVDDYYLSRYACYVVAQNGDVTKEPIAVAQAYFAVQTRRQEVEDLALVETARLEAREKLKETEGKIERVVYKRGIRLPVEFATFKNKHIRGLYGGLRTNDLKKIRGIPKKRALADFDSHVELKAKDLALAMTTHNIVGKDIQGKNRLEREVEDNSIATRDALLGRGIVPESLPPQEDIKKVEKRRRKSLPFNTQASLLEDI
ncbi:DNA damage-inducible protein D [Candidatus Collierbacteria bacterium]|nr:DNA damage-inducible protein D [Candidatus Collierbacteria bacterium]